MEQMADEMTLRADVKDKGRANTAEESSTWARGESEPGEASRDTEAQRPRKCDGSSSPLFSMKMYLRRSSSAASSSSIDSLSSSQPSNVGVDCAGIVLSCLFCRFYDMLPDSCGRLADHCCPNYTQVVTPTTSTPSSNDDSYMDLDCGLCSSCQDASDCLELAMEISEICYH